MFHVNLVYIVIMDAAIYVNWMLFCIVILCCVFSRNMLCRELNLIIIRKCQILLCYFILPKLVNIIVSA